MHKHKSYKYDALLVLGAVMEWSHEKQRWEFPAIIERYTGKLVMGRFRAWAAGLVHRLAPILLVTGGSDTNPDTGEKASRAVELARLIVEEYGVPKEKVVPMGTPKAGSTLGNTENLVEYLRANREIIGREKIAILSPRFQAERAKLMFEINPYFREYGIHLDWLIVEDEIIRKFPDMKNYFDWLYKTPQAETCRQMEQQGIKALQTGAYQSKT